MEILSKDLLTLLRDADFRAAVERVVDHAEPEPQTVIVNVPKDEHDSSSHDHRDSRVVTIRRLAS
jgi:hypothetical protein